MIFLRPETGRERVRSPATTPCTLLMMSASGNWPADRRIRQRGRIAETPHGRIKHNMWLRQLSVRGIRKASGEWTFACAVHN